MKSNKLKFKDDVANNDRSDDQLEEIQAGELMHLNIFEAGVRITIDVSSNSYINIKPIVMCVVDNIFSTKNMARA
jgi:hypothetical protein